MKLVMAYDTYRPHSGRVPKFITIFSETLNSFKLRNDGHIILGDIYVFILNSPDDIKFFIIAMQSYQLMTLI